MAFPSPIYNIGLGYSFSDDLDLYVSNRIHLDAKEGPRLISVTGVGPDFVPSPKDLKDYYATDMTDSELEIRRALETTTGYS